MMFDHYNGWDWGDWLAMSLMMLLVWGAVAAAVVWAVRAVRTGEQRQAGAGPDPAEQVLAERYARGEIDEDEYRRRSEVLKAPGRIAKS